MAQREETESVNFEPNKHPAGGWGSLKAVTTYLLREGSPMAAGKALLKVPGFKSIPVRLHAINPSVTAQGTAP